MKRPVDLPVLSVAVLAAVVLFRGPLTSAPPDASMVPVAAPAAAPPALPATPDDTGARTSSRAPVVVDPVLVDPTVALAGDAPVAASALTPQLIAACMRVAADIDDTLASRLRKLRQQHPEEFRERLLRSRRLVALGRVLLEEPHLYDLKKYELTIDAQVNSLARELRELRRADDSAAIETIETELRNQLRVQLYFEHKSREDYLCRLREVVERLERELETERTQFDDVVEKRMLRLVGGAKERPAPVNAPVNAPVSTRSKPGR